MNQPLTERDAEELMDLYWKVIAYGASTNDVHIFAWMAQFADEIAEMLDSWLGEEN